MSNTIAKPKKKKAKLAAPIEDGSTIATSAEMAPLLETNVESIVEDAPFMDLPPFFPNINIMGSPQLVEELDVWADADHVYIATTKTARRDVSMGV
jgi:hypothetical protein